MTQNESNFRRIHTLFCLVLYRAHFDHFTLYFLYQSAGNFVAGSTCTTSKNLCARAPPAQAPPTWP